MTPSRSRSFAVLAIFLVLALTGCNGVPAPVYCYQIAATTVHTVDVGMTVAGDLYQKGHLTETQKAKLVAAHDVYRPAAQSAVAACKAVGAQGDADKVVKNLRVAADKMIETLVTAGVL